VEAFDVAATDYVLKPFSDDRFHEALQRAKRRVRERRLGALAGEMAAVATELHYAQPREEPRGPQVLDRITIRQGDRSLVVRADEILWIEAEDYCVMIHSTRGRHLVRASLASLESRLDPAAFVRVHRTAIVNVQHVREIRDRDGMCLTLTDGSQVAVSRARKRQVEDALGPRLR
jgi:two-component system LytT family response regulator